MVLTCRGLCKLTKEEGGYKFARQGGNTNLYLAGAKRCQNCDGAYVDHPDGIYCPCCQQRLRWKPRKRHLKEQVLIVSQVRRL